MLFESLSERYRMSFNDIITMPLPAFWCYIRIMSYRYEMEKKQSDKANGESSGTETNLLKQNGK